MRRPLELLFCTATALFLAGAALADSTAPLTGERLVGELRKGGYVVFLRHFATNREQQDTDPLHLENIAAQRQLTDEGRRQATAVGKALRELEIPFGRVVCSRYHRAQESAELLGVGTPEPSDDVTDGGKVVSAEEAARRTEALRHLLATAPTSGHNNLIVSHSPMLQAAAGIEFSDVGEGGAVVFHPEADGKLHAVARVDPPSLWTEWSRQPGPKNN